MEEEKRLPIKGLEKTSLIDYPPYTSAVVFVGGCNFRCPYCHNSDLVLKPNEVPTIDEEKIIDYLIDRKKWIDAVVITGGEPVMYPDLKRFVKRIKEMGMKVKIDTNGSNPKLLWDMLEEKLVDYIAMDFKGPLKNYENIIKMPINKDIIKESISLIMNSGIDYEFRTTVMPKLFNNGILVEMIRPIEGAKKFVIQNFRNGDNILDIAFCKEQKGFSKSELENMKKAVEPYFKSVEVRE